MKIQVAVFWVVTPCSVYDTNVSEEHAASIFTATWMHSIV
jgi:hypothetical protein